MRNIQDLKKYITQIPKVELHLHIEGTLQPSLLFSLAERNKIKLPYKNIEELEATYNFKNLQDFLNIYYQGASVLQTRQDFYDLTWEYLVDAHRQNIVHTEIFFDPQTHTDRGIDFNIVVEGITQAIDKAKKEMGISCFLILSFLRHLPEKNALEIWEIAQTHIDKFIGIGLDSSELGNPPCKFKNVFAKAKDVGMKLMAHAGEEGPPSYIKEAINYLNVNRIDHGNRSLEDDQLVDRLVKMQMPLTVCPLSNVKLANVSSIEEHPILEMLEKGLKVTVNSDDPAYFGGNLTANLYALAESLALTKEHVYKLTRNAFEASFMDQELKRQFIYELDKLSK